MNDLRNYGSYHKSRHYDPPIYSIPPAPPPRPPKIRWPPSPSVEDEATSLSREHSPSLPVLESSEVRMRGSIDQQPIIVEVGKEHEVQISDNRSGKSRRKKKGVRFEAGSSDESSGPPTPIDRSPFQEHLPRPRAHSRQGSWEPVSDRRQEVPLASPSIQDVISNSVRSRRAGSQLDRVRDEDAKRRTEKGTKPQSRAAYAYHPDTAKPLRQYDYFELHQEPQYPGTLEELKHRQHRDPKGLPSRLPFAERHRTMSGSSDSADHRPQNMRHMSAMGYSGESKTPSFARDHPAHLHSPPPDPRSVPAFRPPRPHQHSTIESDSDSEVSPDENPRHGKHHSRNPSGQHTASGFGQSVGKDHPVRLPPSPMRQNERPVTPMEQRRDHSLQPLPERLKPQSQYDLSVKPTRSPRATPTATPSGSPRNSIHDTPPQSPLPTSREGFASKESSPVVAKAPQLPGLTLLASAVPLYPTVPQLKCAEDPHRHSGLRYPSRASSPNLQIPREQLDDRLPREITRPAESGRPRQSTSPLPAPIPSRSLRPDLRVDVQAPTPDSPLRTWNTARPELPPRPISGDFSAQFSAYTSKPPKSASSWMIEQPNSGQRQESHYISQSAQLPPLPMRPPKSASTSLPACPRRGFVTGYNDWWTLRNAPDLDICPACKSNLEAAGSTASFITSPPRSSTYKTRCDLSIPWVRMAWLLVLQGKANKSLVEKVIVGIADEPECPGRRPAARNWRRLYDPEHGRFVPNFHVCPSCIRSVETLFPNMRSCFEPAPHSDPQKKRPCDLSFESPRFARYVDLLDETSNQAHIHRREPNMLRFIALARTYADVRPCTRDDQFRGIAWHFHPSLPDFTVCESCYLDVVWPQATARRSEVAKGFNGTLQLTPFNSNAKLSCQLYSDRMRSIFEGACQRDDFQELKRVALMRVGKERELQARVEQARTLPPEWRKEEMEKLVTEWKRWE